MNAVGVSFLRLELLVGGNDVEDAVRGEVPRQQAGGSPRDLRPQVGTLVRRRRRHIHQLSPQVGFGIDLDEGEGDGPLDLGGQPAHPIHLLRRAEDVLSGDAGRGELEDTGSQVAERPADAEQLVLGCVGTRHRFPVDGSVGDGP